MSELNVSLREWESTGPERAQQLAGFHFENPADRALAAELSRAGALEFDELYDGLRIRARAHVGRIRLGALTVTVMPKIGAPELLALFRYAYGLRDVKRLRSATYSTTGSLFQDLVIVQLYAEIRELFERGLAWNYVQQREELASPRGAIDFRRLALRGPAAAARLPCLHLLNRTVLAGLTLAQSIANDPDLRLALARQRRLLEELAGREELSADLLVRAKRKLNRLVAPYRSLVELIEVLYLGTVVEMESDTAEGRRLPGFLFDMNRFFQRLLQRFLEEHLRSAEVEAEHGLTHFLRYVRGHNPRGRRAPRPRPDYAIKQHGRIVALLDAKYRDLWNAPLPREMLYQLTVYALSQGRGGTAAILYPATDPDASSALVEISDPETRARAGHVWLRPVSLTRMVSFVESRDAAARTACEQWATELAGIS